MPNAPISRSMTRTRIPPRRKPAWTIAVHDASNTREIFRGSSADRDEIFALAREARRHDPALNIWVRDAFGKLFDWTDLEDH